MPVKAVDCSDKAPGSYGTRARYQSSCSSFINFLESEFKMKNLRNLNDKHIVAYVEYRQERKK